VRANCRGGETNGFLSKRKKFIWGFTPPDLKVIIARGKTKKEEDGWEFGEKVSGSTLTNVVT